MSYIYFGLRSEQNLILSLLAHNKRLQRCQSLVNKWQKSSVNYNYYNNRYLSKNTYDWLQYRGVIKNHFPAEK